MIDMIMALDAIDVVALAFSINPVGFMLYMVLEKISDLIE